MMKIYRIEIWRFHKIVDVYTSNSIKRVLTWYKKNWKDSYDCCGCTFYLYRYDNEIPFKDVCELGFCD